MLYKYCSLSHELMEVIWKLICAVQFKSCWHCWCRQHTKHHSSITSFSSPLKLKSDIAPQDIYSSIIIMHWYNSKWIGWNYGFSLWQTTYSVPSHLSNPSVSWKIHEGIHTMSMKYSEPCIVPRFYPSFHPNHPALEIARWAFQNPFPAC